VYVILRNADGSIIGVTQLHAYGVDAKSVFWGTSSRVDYFTEAADPRGGRLRRSRSSNSTRPRTPTRHPAQVRRFTIRRTPPASICTSATEPLNLSNQCAGT
jgi:hypothetical protein